jgi:hypothetical protein
VADLAAVRAALAGVLRGIGPPGKAIRASADMLGSVNPPQAVITPAPGASWQQQTTDPVPSGVYSLRVTVLAGIGDNKSADDLLGAYLSTSGRASLLAAISADPSLGGACDWAVVRSVSGYGWIDWAGVTYLGANIIVEVGVSG